jgi:uncharacterized membrane protein (TIGR02234 family)
MLAQMADDWTARPRRAGPRRELALVLLLGAAGAGLVFLATRQGWAQVHSAAPKPLPSSVATETGQDLVPAAGALAVAALASLAAVLATRRLLRRVTGVVLAGFGAGIAAAVGTGISTANVIAAAAAGGSGSGGAAGGAAGSAGAGSVTAGSASGNGSALVAGFPGRVDFAAFPWHVVALAGAVALIAAGVLVAWRSERLPVMSSRFDSPAVTEASPAAAAQRPERAGRDTATIWESLSRGDDPTAG